MLLDGREFFCVASRLGRVFWMSKSATGPLAVTFTHLKSARMPDQPGFIQARDRPIDCDRTGSPVDYVLYSRANP
jgi:hypothetical protein